MTSNMLHARSPARELDELMTLTEVATLLRVHRRTVSRLVENGRLPPPIKVGAGLRWRRSVIQKFLQSPTAYQGGEACLC
jgi:excisionase family DNA binding protein